MRRKHLPLFHNCCWLAAILVSSPVWTAGAQGVPLERWHWRNPLPQGNTLHNVVFANGSWMAVGELGTLLHSGDGTNWVCRQTGVMDELRDGAYGGGTFVVVGDFGTVLTSPDGITWTPRYAGTFHSLNGVAYADSQFVAVGAQTLIFGGWAREVSGEPFHALRVLHRIASGSPSCRLSISAVEGKSSAALFSTAASRTDGRGLPVIVVTDSPLDTSTGWTHHF
jgi:hypothetical protein